jgi:hypothetical protein
MRPVSTKPLFDCLLFTGKPSTADLKLKPLTTIYQQTLIPPDHSMPTQAAISKALAAYATSTETLCLDVETFGPGYTDAASAAITVANYLELLRMCRVACPTVKFGFYGLLPIRDYWSTMPTSAPTNLALWHQRNDYLLPLAAKVDVLFPSLYTFYADPVGWLFYANANVAEGRRIAKGKPIYPFIWPYYHNAAPVEIRNTLIPPDYWRTQLDMLAVIADGAVLWGGFQIPWDPAAPWFQVTGQCT